MNTIEENLDKLDSLLNSAQLHVDNAVALLPFVHFYSGEVDDRINIL